jgi:geranylgeranyl diphosphate synthase type II
LTTSPSEPVTVRQTLAGWRELVDRALETALPAAEAWPPRVHEAMRYSVFAGGKRVRPLLAMAGAAAVGGDPAVAMPLACAVEMIHTYSLIHDDLPAMDDDDLRRGRPTCHKAFGEAVAILAGDALLTHAFGELARVPPGVSPEERARRLEAVSLLAEACGTSGLVGGQVVDLECEGQPVDGATVERIHRAKTGALLLACVQGGAVLGGADAAALAALTTYGRAIGLAFQVIDDVLDATEDTAHLGKTAGKDAEAEKATYVRVHGIEASRGIASALLDEALRALRPLGAAAGPLASLARLIVERHG